MDRLRNLKTGANGKPVLGTFNSLIEVDDVVLCRRGERYDGSLYLAEHHLVFSWKVEGDSGSKPRTRQVWITYPMISHCTFKPMPPITRHPSAIRLRCRDFTFVAFQFTTETQARDIYEMIRTLACLGGQMESLYAFSYKAPPDEARCKGWEIYDARREFKRMGISPKEADKGWRISNINNDYAVGLRLHPNLVPRPWH